VSSDDNGQFYVDLDSVEVQAEKKRVWTKRIHLGQQYMRLHEVSADPANKHYSTVEIKIFSLDGTLRQRMDLATLDFTMPIKDGDDMSKVWELLFDGSLTPQRTQIADTPDASPSADRELNLDAFRQSLLGAGRVYVDLSRELALLSSLSDVELKQFVLKRISSLTSGVAQNDPEFTRLVQNKRALDSLRQADAHFERARMLGENGTRTLEDLVNVRIVLILMSDEEYAAYVRKAQLRMLGQ
jgi:hypothetical protein